MEGALLCAMNNHPTYLVAVWPQAMNPRRKLPCPNFYALNRQRCWCVLVPAIQFMVKLHARSAMLPWLYLHSTRHHPTRQQMCQAYINVLSPCAFLIAPSKERRKVPSEYDEEEEDRDGMDESGSEVESDSNSDNEYYRLLCFSPAGCCSISPVYLVAN